jgi:hypothetical protein
MTAERLKNTRTFSHDTKGERFAGSGSGSLQQTETAPLYRSRNSVTSIPPPFTHSANALSRRYSYIAFGVVSPHVDSGPPRDGRRLLRMFPSTEIRKLANTVSCIA